jgi:hypothetical protein
MTLKFYYSVQYEQWINSNTEKNQLPSNGFSGVTIDVVKEIETDGNWVKYSYMSDKPDPRFGDSIEVVSFPEGTYYQTRSTILNKWLYNGYLT